MTEKGCENCYYDYFDERAYPCSLCIRGIKRTDNWMPNKKTKAEPQTDEEYINNLPWTEVGNGEQMDIEIARAIVHRTIDDAVIAEDVYPDLRQKMRDAVDSYEPQTDLLVKTPRKSRDSHEKEPQTERSIGCSKCGSRWWCDDRDKPRAKHCNNYGKITDEPQAERRE